jgi:hypothetical protein
MILETCGHWPCGQVTVVEVLLACRSGASENRNVPRENRDIHRWNRDISRENRDIPRENRDISRENT